jgi:hypothetical protein
LKKASISDTRLAGTPSSESHHSPSAAAASAYGAGSLAARRGLKYSEKAREPPAGRSNTCTGWHGMAWHRIAWHRIAWHRMVSHGIAWHRMAWHGIAPHRTASRACVLCSMACICVGLSPDCSSV